MATVERLIPALRFRWLTPAYDTLMPRLLPEARLKRLLVEQANIGPGQRVLDLGSGTGTLTMMLKQAQPAAEVLGLDADSQGLAIGRAKAVAAGVQVAFDEGLAYDMPYSDGTFDRVVSSPIMHHLDTEHKQRALAEVFRVLRPSGELHVLDFVRPRNVLAWVISLVGRRLEETADLIGSRLPAMLRQAGLVEVQEIGHYMAPIGTLSLYRGRKPASGS